VKAFTLQEFQDTTALLPHVVADSISDDSAFSEWAAARTLHLYNSNLEFRRRMDAPNNLDWLYAFMRHWQAAWQLRGGPPK
jgi:hypothetical protein